MGLEELTNVSNVERLKKELRVRLLIFGTTVPSSPLGSLTLWILGAAQLSDSRARPTQQGHFSEGEAADLGPT